MSDIPGPLAELTAHEWGQCLNGVVNGIITAALPDIGANVWIRDPPIIKGIAIGDGFAMVTPLTPQHDPAAGTMTQPDINYPAMVALVKAGDRGVVPATLAQRLGWWTLVFRTFAKVPRPFAVTANNCRLLRTTVTPGDPRILEAWQVAIDAEWLQINCWCRYVT